MSKSEEIFLLFLLILLVAGCAKDEYGADFFADLKPAERTEEKTEIIKRTAKLSTQEQQSIIGELRNPFLTLDESIKYGEKHREIITYLNLSAVFVSEQGSYVVINGSILKKGDFVDNKKLVKIGKKDIILEDAQGEYLVELNKN
ncbi:MAG: hypothetical protein HY810_09180 [Candidatus Omnitrophica bacterium]|nr:hypothetical protein [Candidatus Omnitrophota bacterium]